MRLRLTPLNGQTPSEALAPTRVQLHALVPVYREAIPLRYGDRPGDRADVDVPFVHVHANGDRAEGSRNRKLVDQPAHGEHRR